MISKEVLNIVLAVVILWVGIFTCWVLYYAAKILQQGYKIMSGVNDRIKKIDEAVQSIRERFEHSAAYFGLVAEGVKELAKYIIEKRRESPKKRQAPKASKENES